MFLFQTLCSLCVCRWFQAGCPHFVTKTLFQSTTTFHVQWIINFLLTCSSSLMFHNTVCLSGCNRTANHRSYVALWLEKPKKDYGLIKQYSQGIFMGFWLVFTHALCALQTNLFHGICRNSTLTDVNLRNKNSDIP